MNQNKYTIEITCEAVNDLVAMLNQQLNPSVKFYDFRVTYCGDNNYNLVASSKTIEDAFTQIINDRAIVIPMMRK